MEEEGASVDGARAAEVTLKQGLPAEAPARRTPLSREGLAGAEGGDRLTDWFVDWHFVVTVRPFSAIKPTVSAGRLLQLLYQESALSCVSFKH